MSPVKKGIMAAVIIAGVVIFVLIILAKGGPKTAKIIQEGDQAPSFSLAGANGGQVSLSDYRGKVVMVHFWATWCPPCVEEMPLLEKLYKALSGPDFQLLTVNVDEGGADVVTGFMAKNGLTLPVLLDPRKSISKLYGTFKFPETYIIDRNGMVKYKVIGARDWTQPATVKALQDLITPAR